MPDEPTIDAVAVTPYRVPAQSEEADGTLRWDATELIVVTVQAGGEQGLGYSYTSALAAATLVRDKLADCILGESAFALPRLWSRLNDTLRNAGRPGLGLMAISAVDIALWDLKARLLAQPLVNLLGRMHESVPLYGSGGFVNYTDDELTQQLCGWAGQGISAVKMKIGSGITEDLRRAALSRSELGADIALMVDANGVYTSRDAAALIDGLAECDVRWLEEPVSSDDLMQLRWLRDRAPGAMAITAGEYGWDAIYFRRMLEAQAVDVLQADATRCGCTGLLAASSLCAAFGVPLSTHCAPAIHATLGACLPPLRHIEYFHDHVRLEAVFFEGIAPLRDGVLWPRSDQPGHGLSLRVADAEGYRL